MMLENKQQVKLQKMEKENNKDKNINWYYFIDSI